MHDEAYFTSLYSTLPTEIDSEDFYGNPSFFSFLILSCILFTHNARRGGPDARLV